MSDSSELEKLVSVYIKIRDAIDARREEHKQEMQNLQEQLETVGTKLLDFCNDQNLESVRTNAGTIIRSVTTRYWTSDWESMYNFVKDNDALYLLEQRINKSNMKQFLEDNPDKCPIGLQTDSKYSVVVRRPRSK